MRFALTCGYARSLHAVALLHLLRARGHEIPLCLRVRVAQRGRLLAYLRQLGWRRALRRAYEKLLRWDRDSANAPGELAAMLEFLARHGIASRTVGQACRAVGAREIVVVSLNDPRVVQSVRDARIDAIIYAGGGIIRSPLLNAPRLGVLNAHGGPLPAFRGMNAAEWALFHGVRPTVTVHWMNEGIDTGPILFERPIPVEPWRQIPAGRGVATRVSVEALIEAADGIAAGTLTAAPQDPAAGRQYFVMAEPLLDVVERWLRAGRTPTMDAADFRFAAVSEGRA